MEVVHSAVSAALRFAENKLLNGISCHSTSASVALTTLRAAVDAAASHADHMFVGSVDGNVTVSVNKNVDPVQPVEPSNKKAGSKKRQRCPHEEAADDALNRVMRKGSDSISESQQAAARTAIVVLLTHLRGAEGETALESWSLSLSQVESERPRLILSVRISPGVAVPLKTLLNIAGKAKDGMLTTSSELLRSKFNLPLNAEARSAERFGQKSMSMFATLEESETRIV